MDKAVVYLVSAEISGTPSVDQGAVCMLFFCDMGGVVVGSISMTLCGIRLVGGRVSCSDA